MKRRRRQFTAKVEKDSRGGQWGQRKEVRRRDGNAERSAEKL